MDTGFIFDEDEAERVTLLQPPISFMVIGKPCIGKTTLARAISGIWYNKLIEPQSLLTELLSVADTKDRTMDAEEYETEEDSTLEIFRFESNIQKDRVELANSYLSTLLEGGCVGEQAVYDLLFKQLTSEEVSHYGYVLDGLPSWSNVSWRSISDQINAILDLPIKPDFIIHVKIHNDDAKSVYTNLRVSPVSGQTYSRRYHSPSYYTVKKQPPLVTDRLSDSDTSSKDSESDEGLDEISIDGSQEADRSVIFDFSFLNLDPDEGKGGLVFRPEDTDPEHIVSTFKDTSLSSLEDLLALFGKNKIIEVDALTSPEQMLQSVMNQLACFNIQPSMVPQMLFSPDDDADDLDTMDDEEFLTQLRATNPLHPNCRWKISRWGRFCPVALKSGKMIPGKQKFSLAFLDKVYCLSSQKAVDLFFRCPRKFLLPPQPMLPCKLAIVGPAKSGVSSLAAELSKHTDAVVIDPKQLVKPLLEQEKIKRAESADEQAASSTIATLRNQLIEKLRADNIPQEDIDKELLAIDSTHPEVSKAGSDARQQALSTDLQASNKMYVSAITEVLSKLREARIGEGHAPEGGWILEGIPSDSEQWGLLSDAGILPEHVINLTDSSEDGKYLMLRQAALLGIQDPYQQVGGKETSPEPIPKEQSIEQILAEKEKADKTPEFVLPSVLEEFQERRHAYDKNWLKLTVALKGANLPILNINSHLSTETMRMECMKQLEQVFCYKLYDYPTHNVEEGDSDPVDPQLLPEELGILQTDETELEESMEEKNILEAKPWGDTKQYCPVSLKQNNTLAPGREDIGARYRDRMYAFISQEAKDAFCISPESYMAVNQPLQPPPIRVLLLGPRYAGKTTVGAKLADNLGLFFISFHEWLQEKVMHKLYTKPPLIDEEDLETCVPEEPVEPAVESTSESTMELDATEESIRNNLVDKAPLTDDILEWVKQFWLDDPFKSTGFVLEGFPRTNEEAQFLINNCLFPDSIVMISISDDDVIKRVLPGKLEILKRKQQKEKALYEEKIKKKADKLKNNIETREKNLREEFSLRKEQVMYEHKAKKGTDEETDEDDLQTELDGLEDELNEKLQESREEEEGAQSDTEDLEQEPYDDAQERMRTTIIEKYEAEMDEYKDVQELMGEANVTLFTVEGNKKPQSVFNSIESFMRPYVKYRKAMLTKVIPIDLALAHMLVKSRYKQLTRFGWWCPVQLYDGINTPPLNITSAVIYRSYVLFFSSIKARTRFRSDPFSFLAAPSPGPLVPIQVAVLGPPSSGKTVLSERICKEYGCMSISAGASIRRVLRDQHWSALAQALETKLKAGEDLPVEYIVKAIESNLLQSSVVRRGFVLDSFPVTLSQVDQLAKHHILPIKVFELECSLTECVSRAKKYPKGAKIESPFPFHESLEALKDGINSYNENIAGIRSFYSGKYHNCNSIDGEKSTWNVWSNVKEEIDQNFMQIQSYIESHSRDNPARLCGLCITKEDFEKKVGEFLFYCPVSLVLENALVDCKEDIVYKFGAEYRDKHYLFAGGRQITEFITDPDRFLTPESLALFPEDRPRKLTRSEVKSKFPQRIEFKGYCPVSYIDSGQCYEGLVEGDLEYTGEYKNKLYAMQTEEKRDIFMRYPAKFAYVTLPAKLPPAIVKLPLNRLPMLGYLEQTVSITLHKSLTAVGEFKPKFPFVSLAVSAQIFLALHLKAFNPRSPDYIRQKYKDKLAKFQTHCELVTYLDTHMGPRLPPEEELPRDFKEKLDTFFSFQKANSI
ncbi:Adenylate kinase 9-like [Oopsacas minuta]|uniref:Adenylate kinase 9-like n=1 Tax=Oopsacas minuta TaxID=111878 RepID=A0AAV7JAP3_9METZ|nr:Adenylate kinase 9-like [Oopsacas minuta]